MKTLYNKLWTVLVLLVLSSQVCSAPFYSFDPRSLAMGGTGVASGDLTNASFHNPALLAAAQDSDDFSFTLSGGARAGDPNDLVDKFDTISTSIDSLNSLITQYESSLSVFNNSKTTDNFTTLQTDANAVIAQAKQVINNDLPSINGGVLEFLIGGGTNIAIPSKKFGIAVFAEGKIGGGIVPNFSSQDQTSITNDIITPLESLDFNATNTSIAQPTYTSEIRVIASAISEVGLTLARKFDFANGIAIGISPKIIKVTTFDGFVNVNNADNIDDKMDDFKKSHTSANVDLGLLKIFDSGWRFGLTIKNLIPEEFDTTRGRQIKFSPQARAGIAYNGSWAKFAVDMDLTENNPLGSESGTEFIAIGTELDLKLLQLRLGYRDNLSEKSDADEGIFSVGVGIYLGFHLDAAVAGNSDDIAGSVQVGLTF